MVATLAKTIDGRSLKHRPRCKLRSPDSFLETTGPFREFLHFYSNPSTELTSEFSHSASAHASAQTKKSEEYLSPRESKRKVMNPQCLQGFDHVSPRQSASRKVRENGQNCSRTRRSATELRPQKTEMNSPQSRLKTERVRSFRKRNRCSQRQHVPVDLSNGARKDCPRD